MIVPWVSVRPIKGSQMVEVGVFSFYWMAGTVYPLESLTPGMPLIMAAQKFAVARLGIEAFPSEAARLFPRTFEKAQELRGFINETFFERQPLMVTGQTLTQYEADHFKALIASLAISLKDESGHAYILGVENQRCLSSYTLVERIEDCFSKDSWEVMDKTAKREFEESGKCLALERYTAAGFHALRGVECVIRQYLEKLTGAQLPKDRKRDWGFYIQTLKDSGADGNLIAVLDNIRTLDRNPLMHPEDWLNIDEAIGIFNISQTAIVRLVAGIKK